MTPQPDREGTKLNARDRYCFDLGCKSAESEVESLRASLRSVEQERDKLDHDCAARGCQFSKAQEVNVSLAMQLSALREVLAGLRQQIQQMRDEANRNRQMWGIEHRDGVRRMRDDAEYYAACRVLALFPDERPTPPEER